MYVAVEAAIAHKQDRPQITDKKKKNLPNVNELIVTSPVRYFRDPVAESVVYSSRACVKPNVFSPDTDQAETRQQK